MAYTTIDDPTLFFRVKAYSGTGSAASITFDITDTSMQPDLVWIKNRSTSGNHGMWDSVRGATKQIYPNQTYGESTAANSMTAFNSNGFSVGSDGDQNGNGNSLVAWCWKESTTAGFDIVTYAGDAVAGRNISHSLGAKPHWMIVKNRSASVKFAVYHENNTSAPGTDHLQLNSDAATSDDDSTWDDTEPTSSVFRVKSSTSTNGSSANYVAYLWAPIQGFSKFGQYIGNGNANGPFVYTGFTPAFLMIKRLATDDFFMVDNVRDPVNPRGIKFTYVNQNAAEVTSDKDLDFLSHGFKCRTVTGFHNDPGNQYIYMAWAQHPFVTSTGVPSTAI